MKLNLWRKIEFRFYNLKLRFIFWLNEDSGKLIPTNDLSRAIGKTYLLCEKALKHKVPIMVKYHTTKNYIKSQLINIMHKKNPEMSTALILNRISNLVYTMNEYEFRGENFKSCYVDESLNSEDILKLITEYNFRIRNGFYYNRNIRSPIERKYIQK